MPNFDPTESTSPHEPFYLFSPENFRAIMQRQINLAVTKEVDGITKFSTGNADGRFSNSLPSETIYMSNSDGFNYFIVGASIVGRGTVAAP